jgi:hypothetical protein
MRSAKKPAFGGVSSTPMKYDASSIHKLAGTTQSSFSTKSQVSLLPLSFCLLTWSYLKLLLQLQTPSAASGFAGTKRPNSAISGGSFTGKQDATHNTGAPGELPSVALAAAMDKCVNAIKHAARRLPGYISVLLAGLLPCMIPGRLLALLWMHSILIWRPDFHYLSCQESCHTVVQPSRSLGKLV